MIYQAREHFQIGKAGPRFVESLVKCAAFKHFTSGNQAVAFDRIMSGFKDVFPGKKCIFKQGVTFFRPVQMVEPPGFLGPGIKMGVKVLRQITEIILRYIDNRTGI